jgi:protein-glutamine gamma-glutamyltransferase
MLCIVWRILIHIGKLDYPGKMIRVAVVIFTLLVAASQIRNLGIGLDSAASLLALGFVFKLIEMQQKRDIYVVISLCFVMVMVSFIYSQSVVTTVYVAGAIFVVIATMISLNRSPGIVDNAGTIRLALKITAQSVPLMVVLFLVFPRIAPLWSVPIQTSSNRTGVSDEMSPGDISRLGRSGELAFRVSFENSLPPLHQDLYWRGLVLDQFDGTTWRRRSNSALAIASSRALFDFNYDGRMSTSGDPVYYTLILEPTQQPWLYGLHLAEPQSGNVLRGRNFELFNNGLVTQRLSYKLRSFLANQTDLILLDSVRSRALEIPQQGNLRSRAFAANLREQYSSDRDLAFAVLAYIQQQAFFYTLNPPLLAEDRIDDFLFNTRQGFCEHYASSFTYLMRAAGVPARVVVGYQGAEHNRYEDYAMVYQYNAHAWSEIWLEGEGWVRFDPTAVVSPDRINLGVEAALRDDPAYLQDSRFTMMRFRDFNWLNTLRLRLDAIEYAWNRTVVAYNEDVQFRLFESLIGNVTERKVLMLMSVAAAVVMFLVALTVVQLRPDRRQDPVTRMYLKYCKELARVGLARRRGEGPRDYYLRLAAAEPGLAKELQEITEIYIMLNYALAARSDSATHKQSMKHFRAVLNRLQFRLAPRLGKSF